jgi:hypothetical protein
MAGIKKEIIPPKDYYSLIPLEGDKHVGTKVFSVLEAILKDKENWCRR